MNKKILYGLIGFLVVVALACLWWFNSYSPAPLKESTGSSEVDRAATAADTAQTGAGSAMEKANPFSANVNPMGGYKNPFE